jgi:hypothetical protein
MICLFLPPKETTEIGEAEYEEDTETVWRFGELFIYVHDALYNKAVILGRNYKHIFIINHLPLIVVTRPLSSPWVFGGIRVDQS